MIRTARASDIARIVDIENAAFAKDRRAKLVRKMEVQLAECPEGVLIDSCGRGYIRGILQDVADPHNTKHTTGTKVLYITSVAVHPDHQGKGLGRALLRALRRRFKQSAILVVESRGCPAAKLYLSEGFKFVGTVPGHFSDFRGNTFAGRLMKARAKPRPKAKAKAKPKPKLKALAA